MNPAGINTIALEPSDLAFLQQVYRHMCDERGLPGHTSAATELAASIIDLYQSGVRSERDLQSRLGSHSFSGS